jgi:hypothetical protein
MKFRQGKRLRLLHDDQLLDLRRGIQRRQIEILAGLDDQPVKAEAFFLTQNL